MRQDDPLQYLAANAPQRSVLATIRDQLGSFLNGSNELRMLDSVLENALSIDNILARPAANTAATLNLANEYLALARPDKASNNLNDALNFTTLWRIFNTIWTIEEKTIAPILITETIPVERLSLHQSEFRLPNAEDVWLVTSPYHLLFEIGLTPENIGSAELAEQEAMLLEGESRALARAHTSLADRAKSKDWSMEQLRKDPHMELVSLAKSKFYDRYSWLTGEYLASEEIDIVSTANYVETRHFKSVLHRLNAKAKDKVRDSLRQLNSYLSDTIAERRLMRETSVELASGGMTKTSEPLSALFVLQVQAGEVNNPHSHYGAPVDEQSFDWDSFSFYAEHDLLIRTFYRVLAGAGPGITFGSYCNLRTSLDRWISIVVTYPMSHSESLAFLCKAVDMLSSQCGVARLTFRADTMSAARLLDAKTVKPTVVAKLLDKHPSASYIEVDIGSSVVYCDLEPLYEGQYETGIVIPETSWLLCDYSWLPSLLTEGTGITGSIEHLQSLYAHCFGRLQLDKLQSHQAVDNRESLES
jgi:hypothetical protein